MTKRPLLITILGALFFVVTIALVVSAIFCLIPDIAHQIAQELIDQGILPKDMSLDEAVKYVNEMSIVVFIMAFLTALIAFGFFKGWAFVWYISLILVGLFLLASLISLVGMSQWTACITLVVSIVVIYYLFRPNVKEFFDI